MGSEGEKGMNFELRVQNTQPPAVPTPPRAAVLRSVRITPIVEIVYGRERWIEEWWEERGREVVDV